MEIKTNLKWFNSGVTFDTAQCINELKSPEIFIPVIVNQAVATAMKTLQNEGVLKRISPARLEAIIDEIATVAYTTIENDLEDVIDNVIATATSNAEDPSPSCTAQPLT